MGNFKPAVKPDVPYNQDPRRWHKYWLKGAFDYYKQTFGLTSRNILDPDDKGIPWEKFRTWMHPTQRAFPFWEEMQAIHKRSRQYKSNIFPYRALDLWYAFTGEVGTDTERMLLDENGSLKLENRELKEEKQVLSNQLLEKEMEVQRLREEIKQLKGVKST